MFLIFMSECFDVNNSISWGTTSFNPMKVYIATLCDNFNPTWSTSLPSVKSVYKYSSDSAAVTADDNERRTA
jgi:hypothetical protein